MGRIGRSFQLMRQSYRILMQDRELMVLPLISGAIIVAVVVAMTLGFGVDTARVEQHGPGLYLPLFLMYVVTYAIGIFFQAAVVAGATERMRGGDPTVGSALSAAVRRIGPILMWAIVAATVGMGIRAIHVASAVGRISRSLLGATALAPFHRPVLVWGNRSGLVPALCRCVPAAWGERWLEDDAGGGCTRGSR